MKLRMRRGAVTERWVAYRPVWRSVWALIGLVIAAASLFGAHFGNLSAAFLCWTCLFAALLGL